MNGRLRVLALGGLGEIGKNMTVFEYDNRLVVVDTGLRFPTADMLGIDLVLPDFTYLRDRADDIEAIVITHGHEDHLGALPWVMRELDPTTVCFASDYCHWDCEFPNSVKLWVERGDLSDDDKRRILGDNPSRLYGLPVPAGSSS